MKKSFESKNSFQSLRRPDEDDDAETKVPKPLVIELADALKGRSQNRMRKERPKVPKSKKVRFMETSSCKCCSDTISGHFPDNAAESFSEPSTLKDRREGILSTGVDDGDVHSGCARPPAGGRPPMRHIRSLKHSAAEKLPRPDKCEFPKILHQSSKDSAKDINDELIHFAKEQCKPRTGRNLNIFNKVMRSGSLMPITQSAELQTRLGKFEILTAVIDSGATVAVMNPSTGASYKIEEGSANGTEYEIASGDTLEDLGEKRMAVLTAEGTMRGYTSRCADVTKSLQSVRALVNANHAVCFGLGDGHDHLIINKVTGEMNRMRDDGVNYLQDLIIVPPDRVDAVAQQLAMIAGDIDSGNGDSGGGNEADFQWQGE